jgi:hypothetical protein
MVTEPAAGTKLFVSRAAQQRLNQAFSLEQYLKRHRLDMQRIIA